MERIEEAKIKDLFRCCKEGNLQKLRRIVEEEEIDLNIRDKWDSTPLYYACLCGHEKLVEYLLQNGAKCQANTFDGERCLYSALTQKIKEMLKNFKAITKDCIRRDNYVEFFKMLHISQALKDVCFIVHGSHIFAHRVILSARCEYFATMFETKWKNKKYINIKHPQVTPSAFNLLIQYIYSDRIEVPVDEFEDIKRLSTQCHLDSLIDKLIFAKKSFHSYVDTKPNVKENVFVLSIEPKYGSFDLNESYILLAQRCLPNYFRYQQFPSCLPDFLKIYLPEDEDGLANYLWDDGKPAYADICFNVENYVFHGHKLFFCNRSDFFKSLCNFSEMSIEKEMVREEMMYLSLNDISAEAFAVILTFIYTNTAVIPDDLIYETIHFSTMYMLPALKKRCANQLKSMINEENIFEIFKMARLYDLQQLESQCSEFMSHHLENIITRQEFSSLILQDANEIKDREETDTIPIIDDIRFHLNKTELPGFFTERSVIDSCGLSTPAKFSMIDELLGELGLDA